MAELKALVLERGRVKASLTRLIRFYEESATTASADILQNRLDDKIGLLQKFEDIQYKIMEIVSGTTSEEDHEREHTDFEFAYYEIVTKIRSHIKNLQPQVPTPQPLVRTNTEVSTATTISTTPVQLPVIKIQPFNGSLDKWIRFRDTFESVIHNNEALTNIQKFHYLESVLTDSAARVIESLGVSDANYETAWKSLKDRFEDSHTLIKHHSRALIEQPAVSKQSHVSLRQFVDDVSSHIHALKKLGMNPDGPITSTLLVLKLDTATQAKWHEYSSSKEEFQTVQNLLDFLNQRCKVLETNSAFIPCTTSKALQRVGTQKNQERNLRVHVVANKEKPCLSCKEAHLLRECPEFRKLTPYERVNKVRSWKACYNCLESSHQSVACTRGTCRKCGKKHHTLLHLEPSTGKTALEQTTNQQHNTVAESSSSNQALHTNVKAANDHVMLSTALVYVEGRNGRKHECRVLLDPGSQGNLIREDFCKRIGLQCSPSDTSISGVGSVAQRVLQKTKVKIMSRYGGYKQIMSCLVLPKISSEIPSSFINKELISVPPHIKLADPDFNVPRDIDMLIGNEYFWDLISVGQQRLGRGRPVIQKTQLGWIFAGRLSIPRTPKKFSCHLVTNDQLDQQLRNFWEVEHVTSSHPCEKPDTSDPCERLFASTTIRKPDGRYCVSIPFTDDLQKLGNSRHLAERRLLSLERKFEKSPELKMEYTKFLQEYEALGHMTLLNEIRDHTTKSYYLPHHAVFKASTTTKLRVVFDGSAKTDSGLSLNDVQLVGPTVQDDLFSIIIRFRSHKYVLSADIAKMYRQIQIQPEQRSLQRILWRTDSSEPIRTYELNTVTYGTASAPFLATRTLKHLAEENLAKFPDASRTIISDFYVDDLLTGTNTIEEAITLKNNLTHVLRSAGFELRKWAANHPEILTGDNHKPESIDIQADKDPKTLGLLWTSDLDQLRYCVNPVRQMPSIITKRIILSEIARIFDPLGLMGPAIVKAKILLQRLWQLKLSWDESLPQDIHSEWNTYRTELPKLNDLCIPRRVLECETDTVPELHGFCDASERAYGAAIYLRSFDSFGTCTVRLLCAKSRVAPLKTISLPRLELCGALLLAQLATKVKNALRFPVTEHYWCDSTIVLAWLRAPSNKWKTFVANRTSEIQRLTGNCWRHVISEDNPADLISRGVSPSLLESCTLWWDGPHWLSLDRKEWPISEPVKTDAPEARQAEVITLVTTVDCDIFSRFSKYQKLLRVISYCYRFIRNARANESTLTDRNTHHAPRNDKQTQGLSTTELSHAHDQLVKMVQATEFAVELDHLRNGQQVPRSSKISSLAPFIDEGGLLRVGGRIDKAPIPFNQKHPIILPAKHLFTKMIITHEHERLLHAGNQLVVASVRARYWPLNCKSLVKGVIRNCIKCFRAKPNPTHYVMGNLPSSRVTPTRPFYTCGVDYAGPFITKERTRSRTTLKSYLCIFVCFSTKAVHLELATDLSTASFLNCLRRFISRRGRCQNIYSDNGTNFVGAKNELQELGILLRDETHNKSVQEFLLKEQIQWHLIPPHAPHFGGLWESAVKSAKHHLRRVIGETRLTYEELYTVLSQVEACMNSRPLCPLTNDPSDLSPLTPAHFLIGEPLTILPHPDVQGVNVNRLSRYELIQNMFQHFWHRWHTEYLHHLQQRNKWQLSVPERFKVGTLVTIREDNLPPLKWRLGRIVEIHPGQDNVTRVVTVKTADGVFKRPVSKICILPGVEDRE